MEGSSSSSKKWAPATVNDAPPLDYAQTKGEDIELWAIRVPPGFDASQLDGLAVGEAGAEGDGFVMKQMPEVECDATVCAFPSAKKKRWLVAKPFARQLVVSVPPPPLAASASSVPPPLPPVPQVPGLTFRQTSVFMSAPEPAAAEPASPRKRPRSYHFHGHFNAPHYAAAAAESARDSNDAEAAAKAKSAKKAAKKQKREKRAS